MTFAFSHDHVGITVTPADLDATIAWYSRHLGFTLGQRLKSHGTALAYLTAGDARIELLAGAPDRGGAPAGNVLTSMDPSRLHHLCLAVADLDAAVSRLLELDVPLTGGPLQIPETGQRIAFVTDNAGTIIELTEPGTWPSGRNARVMNRSSQPGVTVQDHWYTSLQPQEVSHDAALGVLSPWPPRIRRASGTRSRLCSGPPPAASDSPVRGR